MWQATRSSSFLTPLRLSAPSLTKKDLQCSRSSAGTPLKLHNNINLDSENSTFYLHRRVKLCSCFHQYYQLHHKSHQIKGLGCSSLAFHKCSKPMATVGTISLSLFPQKIENIYTDKAIQTITDGVF